MRSQIDEIAIQALQAIVAKMEDKAIYYEDMAEDARQHGETALQKYYNLRVAEYHQEANFYQMKLENWR